MKVLEIIRLEAEDGASVQDLLDAKNMLGGHVGVWTDAELKPFGRIRANDFTMNDALDAFAVITQHAQKLRALKAEDCPFPDIPGRTAASVSEDWVRGAHVTADIALQKASNFLIDLQRDYQTHMEAQA